MNATFVQVKKRPLWRRIVRFFAWTFLILMIPVVCFVIWNRIDEAPTPLALHYASPTTRHVEDANNAWLYMVGIGAAPADDPAAFGKRRVDAFAARSAMHPIPPADAAEIQLFEDPVPAVVPDAEIDSNAELCPSENVDCLLWAQSNRSMLHRLREANALRLERYEHLLNLPGWQSLYPAFMDRPFPDLSVARLHLDLIALDLADLRSAPPSSDTQLQLERLASSIGFWRQVRSQPQDLDTILKSGRIIERSLWLLSAWLDHATTQQLIDNGELIQRMLGEQPPPLKWDAMLSDRFQEVSRGLEDAQPGLARTLGQCISGNTENGCFFTLAMSSTFAPQATRNLKAIHLQQMQRLLEASPLEIEEVAADAGKIITATFPLSGDTGDLLKQMSFNFTGRILASVSIPAYDYHLREHDREALRRMVAIKYLAREHETDSADMSMFMKNLQESLHNPITQEPFNWILAMNAFYFSPLAENYWNRHFVEVEYHGPYSHGIDSCSKPIVFEVTELPESSWQEQSLRFASCSSGLEPEFLDDVPVLLEDQDEDSRAALDSLARFARVELNQRYSHIGVALWLDTGRTRLAYRQLLEPKDGTFDEVLEPLGHPTGPKVRVRSLPEPAPNMIAIKTTSVAARDAARSIAETKGLTLIGTERLSMERITMHLDASVHGVLEAIADMSGLELVESSPERFEFRPIESTQGQR